MNDIDKIIEMAQQANFEYDNFLFVPVLDGFIPIKQENPKIMVAKNNNLIEQIIFEEPLKNGETYKERISAIEDNLRKSLKYSELYNGNYLHFYKDYSTNIIDYKLYLQDIITDVKDNEINFIRQINAYFINPITSEFSQLSISAGQYTVGDKFQLIKDINDISKDEITIPLEKMIETVMNNIEIKSNN